MRRDIEFKSKGVTCRGWFYTPDQGKKPYPVMVLAGGWCYVKEIVMPFYAEMFAKAGCAALVFDYRNFGVSDGQPRQHFDHIMQMEDYKNAISFVETLPEVDPERIGIYGISLSGGTTLVVAATDPRVKCVVSVVGVMDGYANMRRSHGFNGFPRLVKAVTEDRKRRFEGKPSEYIPMSTTDPEKVLAAWPYPDTYEIFTRIQKTVAPLHEHRNTIESVENLMNYNVWGYLDRILYTAVLMIVTEGDRHTPWDLQIKAFNLIQSTRKKMVVIPKTGHMDIYGEQAKLEMAAKAATEWVAEQLVKPYEKGTAGAASQK